MDASATPVWEIPEFYLIDNEFFSPNEKKQLENAYRNFLTNTKYLSFDDEQSDEEETVQSVFRSKVQLFQLLLRSQPVNIRHFNQHHQQQRRVFVERLFYLVLNGVVLRNFSTFPVNSIIHISKELEKYQRSTNRLILNAEKLNTIIQFVLSFSSSTLSTFQLNNLFYLLINDMNDFSGKIIDRVAELLKIYHSMTYGHTITKQYFIATIDHAISTVNYANPVVYPFYENFLNTAYVYKGPLMITSSRISLYTIIQNLSIVLLGLTIDDFECEDHYLSLTSEQCYHIRLLIRRLTYIFQKYDYSIEYPLDHIDKQIVIYLIKSILIDGKTYETLKRLLDFYMMLVQGFSQTKIKHLLYDLLINASFELYAIETIRYFIEVNHLEKKHFSDHLWLNHHQLRLVTHRLYSKKIYSEIFIPLINGVCREERSIEDILTYLDNQQFEQEQVIDVQEMKTKLTIVP